MTESKIIARSSLGTFDATRVQSVSAESVSWTNIFLGEASSSQRHLDRIQPAEANHIETIPQITPTPQVLKPSVKRDRLRCPWDSSTVEGPHDLLNKPLMDGSGSRIINRRLPGHYLDPGPGQEAQFSVDSLAVREEAGDRYVLLLHARSR